MKAGGWWWDAPTARATPRPSGELTSARRVADCAPRLIAAGRKAAGITPDAYPIKLSSCNITGLHFLIKINLLSPQPGEIDGARRGDNAAAPSQSRR